MISLEVEPLCTKLAENDNRKERKKSVNRHSTVTHYQRPNMTHPQEGGTGGEVSEILFFSAKSKRRPSLIYSMQIIPVCLSIVARRKGVSATRRGGLNWTPISLLVGHPCKLFHIHRFGGCVRWLISGRIPRTSSSPSFRSRPTGMRAGHQNIFAKRYDLVLGVVHHALDKFLTAGVC